MSGMPRLTSYTSPQVPPSTPLTAPSFSPFDTGLATASSKTIGIVSPDINDMSDLSIDDQIIIRVVNQKTVQPVAGISAKLTAFDDNEQELSGNRQPFATFTGNANFEGRITNWRSHGRSAAELSDRLMSDATYFKWYWVLHLESGQYWSSLGSDTSLREVVVRLQNQATLKDHEDIPRQISILLGQWGFEMSEGSQMNHDLA